MKGVLISIQPKWCEKIANDKKTIEVRKTRPNLETPFKVYIYCTNTPKRHHLYDLTPYNNGERMYGVTEHNKYSLEVKGYLNGKVIGEFVCDRIYTAIPDYQPLMAKFFNYDFYNDCGERLQDCLTSGELSRYGDGAPLYGWHISDLKIYDKPKELREFELAGHCFNIKNVECKTNAFGEYVFQYHDNSFCRICKYYNSDFGDCDKPAFQPLKRPPQSWCYVEGR